MSLQQSCVTQIFQVWLCLCVCIIVCVYEPEMEVSEAIDKTNNDNTVQWAIGNIHSTNLYSSSRFFSSLHTSREAACFGVYPLHLGLYDTFMSTDLTHYLRLHVAPLLAVWKQDALCWAVFILHKPKSFSLTQQQSWDRERGGCWRGRWWASAGLASPHTLHNKCSLYDLGFSYLHLEPS